MSEDGHEMSSLYQWVQALLLALHGLPYGLFLPSAPLYHAKNENTRQEKGDSS